MTAQLTQLKARENNNSNNFASMWHLMMCNGKRTHTERGREREKDMLDERFDRIASKRNNLMLYIIFEILNCKQYKIQRKLISRCVFASEMVLCVESV